MAKILVVDDSVIMRKNISENLKRAGHTVVGEASNGREAIEVYSKLLPDLVTMDITMPEMDGITSVEKITNEYPNALIVMVSAMGQKKMVLDAMKKGASSFIVKPVRFEVLESIVSDVLGETAETSSAKPEPSEAATKDETFDIKNESGVFHVLVYNNFNNATSISFERAINGLLFVQPLKVKFNLQIGDNIDPDTRLKLAEIVEKVRDSDGEVEIQSDNQELINVLT